jgi:hypothetical protein
VTGSYRCGSYWFEPNGLGVEFPCPRLTVLDEKLKDVGERVWQVLLDEGLLPHIVAKQ